MTEVIEFGYYGIENITKEGNSFGVYIKAEPDVVMPRRTYDDPPNEDYDYETGEADDVIGIEYAPVKIYAPAHLKLTPEDIEKALGHPLRAFTETDEIPEYAAQTS